MREPGWYWVKWLNSEAVDWECARWSPGLGWFTAGTDQLTLDISVVGPKIDPPHHEDPKLLG